MPTPTEGESQDDYISRCIPMVMEEGTAKDAEQAAAICHSMWEQHMEGRKMTEYWITTEQMRRLCPSCAEKMEAKGFNRINLKQMPEHLMESLCEKFGEAEGFRTRCMESSIPVSDIGAFCNWLKQECGMMSGGQPEERKEYLREHKELPILEPEIDDRIVKSIFAVMGHIDEGNDRILNRAFAKTLKERKDRVRVLWQHDNSAPPIGVPLDIKEIDKAELPALIRSVYPKATGALYSAVKYLDTPRGNEVLYGIRENAIRENSIGYDAIIAERSDMDGIKVRNLKEIRLWDLSPVNWGMQPATVNLKSHSEILLTELSSLYLTGQTKEGRVLSSRNLERLKNALDTLSSILLSAEPPEEDIVVQKALTEQIMIELAIRERDPVLFSVR